MEFYHIDGQTVLAAHEGQARAFVIREVYAAQEGDPGIVETAHEIRLCPNHEGKEVSARVSGLCHLCEAGGSYRRTKRPSRREVMQSLAMMWRGAAQMDAQPKPVRWCVVHHSRDRYHEGFCEYYRTLELLRFGEIGEPWCRIEDRKVVVP